MQGECGLQPAPDHPHQELNGSTIRILVAEGDTVARRAIREALCLAGYDVVAQAADSSQTVAAAERYAPDVAVVDSDLPPDGGLAAVTAMADVAPDTRVILLASNGRVDGALTALTQGAAGYLRRDIELDALGRAVEGVMKGEAAISRAMALRLLERVRALAGGFDGMRPVRSELTTREWEVVDLLKTGASTSVIAEALVISPDTVHTHVRHLMRKLGVHSRADAVVVAERVRSGLPMLT